MWGILIHPHVEDYNFRPKVYRISCFGSLGLFIKIHSRVHSLHEAPVAKILIKLGHATGCLPGAHQLNKNIGNRCFI